MFNIVGIIPFNHNSREIVYNYSMKKEKSKNKNKNKSKRRLYEVKLPRIKQNTFFDNKINSNIEFGISIMKSNVRHCFNPMNLKGKMSEFRNEYYKKMILVYQEEKARALTSGFSLIFPLKSNIDHYSKILIKDNSINDTNIALWSYILNNE